MGHHEHQAADVDPHTLENARNLWSNFMCGTKYLIIGVVVLLLLMAAFLV